MANISGASLAQIQQRLRDTPAYHPFDADTFCDWAMEAGDIVTVRRGEESYQSPVHSSHLVWRGKQNMELNASGTKEREAIARVSKQKYARGGYGMRQQKSLYYDFYSEDGYLHSYIQMSESILVTHFDNSLSDLHSEFSQTAERIQSSVWANESLIYSTVEQTATYIKSEVASAESRMGSSIYQTASGIRSDVWAAESLIYSTIEQTASNIRAEVISAESRMGSSIEMAASGIRSEVWAANSTIYSTIEQTASRIDQTVAQQQNDLTELKGRVIVEAGKASLVAEITDNRRIIYYRTMDDFPDVGDPNIICLDTSTGKYYEWKASAHGYVETEPNKVIKASSITTAINEAGDSETHIDSDHIYIGNQKSTTVINGKITANDVSADFIAGKLATLSTLQVNGITSSGSVSLSGTTTLSGTVQIQGSDGNTRNLATGIRTLYKASEVDGTVTLQYIDFNGTTHDVSFSRAISSASWEWTNGMPKVTLSPQNQSFTGRQITHGTPYQDSQDNDRWKMEIQEIDTSTTPPRYVTIPGRTIGLYNYLEAKTGTAKITSNGTFAPGTGKIGFSSVEVDVDATVTGAWEQSNPQSSANPYNKYTVRKGSGAVVLAETVNVTQSYDSTTHKYTATVSATNRSSVITAVTGTDAYDAGYGDAHLTGSWDKSSSSLTNNNRITISKTTSGSSNSLNYVISAAASIAYNSSTHKYTATAKAKVDGTQRGDDATAASGTEAYDAGYGSAHLIGSWDKTSSSLTNNNQITISKTTSGSTNSLKYVVSAAASISYDSSSHKYTATAKAKVDGTQRGDDATATGGTEAYDAGHGAGYGSAHLTGSWDKTSSGLTNNNRITISKTTSGSSNSLNYVISAAASIAYNSSTHKYTATAKAKVDGTQRGDDATAASGTEAYTDGQNSVTITKTYKTNGVVEFTKSAGTTSTKGVKIQLSMSNTWTGNSRSWDIKDIYDSTSGTVVVSGVFDATSRYNAGYSAGQSNPTDAVVADKVSGYGWPGSNTSTATCTVTRFGSNKDLVLTMYKNEPYVDLRNQDGGTVARLTYGSTGASLRYVGADYNPPASDVVLNDYTITTNNTSVWFLVKAVSSSGADLDAKYVGVDVQVSGGGGGGHNNPIKFTRGAAGTAPNTYTWSAIIGTNVTGSSTEYTFYY